MFVKSAAMVAALSLLGWASSPAEAATNVFRRAPSATLGTAAAAWFQGRPALRPSRTRSQAATAPAYTIVDIGAPTAKSYPTGFNNTGQIFGQGDTGCFVWSGRGFDRLPIPSAGTQNIACQAISINDAKPDGTYEVVGETANPDAYSTYAFAVTGGTPIVYYPYESSYSLGVNDNGVSVAAAIFGIYINYYPGLEPLQLTTAADGHGYFALLQPYPSGASRSHYLLPTVDQGATLVACAFGGCVINNNNEVLGYDFGTTTENFTKLAVYTVGKASSLVDLPINVNYAFGQTECCTVFAFNDRDDILYSADDKVSNGPPIPAIYNIASRKETIIPLATPSCPKGVTYGLPLSLNNKGEVLGTYYCPTGPDGYFIWDAASGTRDLGSQIPETTQTIYPVGVNDSGQILIGLVNGSVTTWGTLNPSQKRLRQPVRTDVRR